MERVSVVQIHFWGLPEVHTFSTEG
uniref:Uncharacterized protein n=1 Tax=Anguilla anguilla TaxID=7936 RepID=A0A0E9R1H9_ANGAN